MTCTSQRNLVRALTTSYELVVCIIFSIHHVFTMDATLVGVNVSLKTFNLPKHSRLHQLPASQGSTSTCIFQRNWSSTVISAKDGPGERC